MKRAALGVVVLLVACGGGQPAPKVPSAAPGELAKAVAEASREEAHGDPQRAIDLWERVVDVAVQSPKDPWQLVAEEAALDALVLRSVDALDEAGVDTALVYRTRGASLTGVSDRLAAAARLADDPFSAGFIARALHDVASHRGDVSASDASRVATGCAGAATVVGPLTWTAVTGVAEEDPLARADAGLEAKYPGGGAFAAVIAPVVAAGRGCSIDPALTSTEKGVRDLVVDVKVDRAQTIGVALRAHGAATLRAGGRIVVERPYALGGGEVSRFARVDVPKAGTVRLVARVGMDDDGEGVEIDAWDEHGKPLPSHAPLPGEAADVAVSSSQPVAWPEARSPIERTAAATAALATGELTTAEEVATPGAGEAPAELVLAYARAVAQAADLDTVHRAERARGAYERVLEAWPGAWEAIAAHAVLGGVRRGPTEQRIWTLRDLEERRAKAGVEGKAAVLDLFEAAVAGRDRLFDRASAALTRARESLGGAVSLVHDVDRLVVPRSGAERVAFECKPAGDGGRARLECYDALRASGDRAAAAKELDRVRALYGSPKAYLALTLRDALTDGDLAAAGAAFDVMLPGERTLSAQYAVKPGATAREALRVLAPTARDAPGSLPGLMRASGDDPTVPFAGIAERLAAQDRASRILPSAATAVLAHDERYEITASGLAHFVLFDVRRVSGTTDVEQNAQADPPQMTGRTTMRILRRRMFKKDGRVVEPDRTPNAAQAHAELSQLEQGDVIEAIYEGFTLPGDANNIAIDTADLLPERTAVHDATVELRFPASLHASLWSHALLGKPTDTKEGGARVVRWHVQDTGERRLEEGTPKMDRDVAVSFSTATWDDTARALRETLAALDDREPEVRSWALAAAKGKTEPRAIVDAVVTEAGRSVKEAESSALSDLEVGRPAGAQETTARTILANHEGSRTWLVVRALRELGVQADVAIAESEPYSADPAFPPHEGRFTHPLAIAHVPGGAGATSDVWIDADVPGPPLPAGRISPELRGRSVLRSDGRVEPVPTLDAKDERDEVDIRLAVDARGDAKGSLEVLLRGRAAQELAEALVRMVGDERQRMLRGVALAWVPFADVDDVVLSSTEESWQVAVRAKVTVPGYAQVEGTSPAGRTWALPGLAPIHAVYPRPTSITLGATFASQGGRKDALAVSHAMQFHVHRRVELPAGATVVRAPGALDVKDAILAAQRRVGVSASLVEDDYVLTVSTGTVEPGAYGAFAADAHGIDDGFLASTRVKPGP